jgi:hypothetical protein
MSQDNKLYILWTNADLITSEKMVMMYATNAMLKHWWDEVTVIIWGATAKVIAENKLLQGKLEIAKLAGVKFTACKACTDQLGVSEQLKTMEIEIIYWGEELTRLLKDNEKLISV